MHAIFAFVGQDLIDKYGGYAGFAAIPGLAVMALLYFAQAREVKRLREWAEGIATGRDSLPAARSEPEPARPPRPPRPARPAAPPRPAGKPSLGPPKPAVAGAAAAGAGAAAAATNDDKDASDTHAKPEPAAPAAATAAAAAKGAEVDDTTTSGDSAEEREREPAVAGAAAAAAPTALREREGGSVGPSAPGRADTGAGGSPDRPGPPRSARPSSPNLGRPVPPARSAAALRANRAGAAAPPRGDAGARPDASESHSRRPLMFIVGGIVILILGVVIALTQFGGDDGSKRAANSIEGTPSSTQSDGGGNATAPTKKNPAQPVSRGEVTVSVLNGTTAPGLAATVGDQLEGKGFRRGTVANASDQQQQATTVYYGPGQKVAAQEVAKLLKVSTVKPLDAGTQAIAGADAGVVVIVGNDRTS